MQTNYRLIYRARNNAWKTYVGDNEVYARQSPQDACDLRLGWHIKHPKLCVDGAVEDSFDLQPYGRLLCHRNAFCQEAIDTAFCLGTDPTCRGACFARKYLNSLLETTASHIRRVTKHLAGQSARQAVFKYAESLSSDHPLVRHLEHRPYHEQKVEPPGEIVKRTTEGRSGKPGCQTRQRQLENREYGYGGRTHRRLKRGKNPSERVAAEHDRRKVPRGSGVCKNPAARPRV